MSDLDNALIWAVHRTQTWWKHVGDSLGFAANTVVTDRPGIGDRSLSGDFYAAYRRPGPPAQPFDEAQVADIIARCRVLRWLPLPQAERMVAAMTESADRLLDAVKPDVFACFPIDSYVSDVLARRARTRGVPCFEATASALPDMTMLMHRGRLITEDTAPHPTAVQARVDQIAHPTFTPAYVQGRSKYSAARFARTLAYFRTRGLAFKAWSHVIRDPLRCHLLDAQSSLGHKARWRDMRIVRMIDGDWRQRIADIPREKLVSFGLQLIPEAAIDYWIEDLRLVEHEDMLVEAARRLTDAGYTLLVKDHPLQFGFRQTELLDRLKALPNVLMVPYEVSGNELLSLCGANLTATGTLGLQCALAGDASIIGEAYYATPDDFLIVHQWEDLATLPERLAAFSRPANLDAAQARVVGHLLRGSFDADFYSFQNFDPKAPNPAATRFGEALGRRMRQLGPMGEDWHGRHMPPGGARWPGSPLD